MNFSEKEVQNAVNLMVREDDYSPEDAQVRIIEILVTERHGTYNLQERLTDELDEAAALLDADSRGADRKVRELSVPASELQPGDHFTDGWNREATVREVSDDLPGRYSRLRLVKITYDSNPPVVNPPGVLYTKRESEFAIRRSNKKNE